MSKAVNTIFILGIIISSVFGQSAEIEKGIQAFYQAEFEKSIQILQTALSEHSLQNPQLFQTHIYIAFSKYRLDYIPENIEMHIEQAILAYPDTALEKDKIPPDLFQLFSRVRNRMIGSVYVTSKPDSASLVLLNLQNNDIMEYTTPVLLSRMQSAEYSMVVSQKDWKAHAERLVINPGESDTVHVVLQKSEKSFFHKYWPYGAGLLLSGLFLYNQISETDSDQSENPSLPLPPDRPD